jgi:hypothetical protein
MGIANIFFPNCKASAGVSNPAPHIIPLQWIKLLLKACCSIGLKRRFPFRVSDLVSLEKISKNWSETGDSSRIKVWSFSAGR